MYHVRIFFNNGFDDDYLLKIAFKHHQNNFATEYKILSSIDPLKELNIPRLHPFVPFYYFHRYQINFFFMRPISDSISLSDILFEKHHLSNSRGIESIQNISESFGEIDGGILHFLLKCHQEITKIKSLPNYMKLACFIMIDQQPR